MSIKEKKNVTKVHTIRFADVIFQVKSTRKNNINEPDCR